MTYIAHYGVGHKHGGHSGRYQWGTGKNPRQSEGGLKIFNKGNKEKKEYTRKEIINSGDIKLVKQHANDLSSNELRYALNRVELLNRTNALYADQTAFAKTYNAVNTVKNVGVATVGALTTYSIGASLLNEYAGTNLPVIKIPNVKKK